MIRDPSGHLLFLLPIGWIAICALAGECRHVKNVCITPSLSPETHLNNPESSKKAVVFHMVSHMS